MPPNIGRMLVGLSERFGLAGCYVVAAVYVVSGAGCASGYCGSIATSSCATVLAATGYWAYAART